MHVETEDTWLPQPDWQQLDLGTVLGALADPVRLEMVRQLHKQSEATCTGARRCRSKSRPSRIT